MTEPEDVTSRKFGRQSVFAIIVVIVVVVALLYAILRMVSHWSL